MVGWEDNELVIYFFFNFLNSWLSLSLVYGSIININKDKYFCKFDSLLLVLLLGVLLIFLSL